MGFFAFIMVAALCIVIYFALRSGVAFLLEKYASVEKQNGILKFGKLKFDVLGIKVQLENLNIWLNPIGIFTSNIHIFWLSVDSVKIEQTKPIVPPKTQEKSKRKAKKMDIVNTSFFRTFIYRFIRRIFLHVGKLEYSNTMLQLKVTLDTFDLTYTRDEESLLKIGYERINLSHPNIGEFSFNHAQFSVKAEPIAMLRSISLTKSIFFISIRFNQLHMNTDESTFTFSKLIADIDFIPGKLELQIPEFTITLPFAFPKLSFGVGRGRLHFALPLYDIPHMTVDQFILTIENLIIGSVSEDLISINRAELTLLDLSKSEPVITIDEVNLNYTSLDGIEFFPLVKLLRGEPSLEPSRPKIVFPEIECSFNKVGVRLVFTDNAILEAASENVVMKERVITFPLVRGMMNHVPMIKGKNLQIYSEEETYLSFKADSVCLRQRNKVNIADFLDNVIYGYYLIKPFVSSGIFDSETLPFPIRIHAESGKVKVDDNPISSSLIRAQKDIGPILKDRLLFDYIMGLKLEKNKLTPEQTESAKEQIGNISFQRYKEAVKKAPKPSKLTVIGIEEVNVTLDSRGVTGMVGTIFEVDPSTQKYYSHIGWETLEGFKISGDADRFFIQCFDLPKPLLELKKVQVNGPIIIGELDAQAFVDIDFTVCSKEFTTKKTATDIKMFSDLTVQMHTASVFYGSSLQRIYDDFADAISAFFPDGVNPSPALKWWDKFRSMMRGKYSLSADRFDLLVTGSHDPYDMEDVLDMTFTNGTITFLDGTVLLNSSGMDATRYEQGPKLIHFPNFEVTTTLTWDTEKDSHLHMVAPDVTMFKDETYDSYKDFRAKGIDIFFDIKFTPDTMTPYVAVDFAHFYWNFAPMMNLFNSPLDECYLKKVFLPVKRTPPVTTFGRLNRVITYRFDVSALSLRVFDTFPSLDTSAFNGSSVDATLVNPRIWIQTIFPYGGEDVYNATIAADALQVNLTDLPELVNQGKILSTTLMELENIEASYGEHSHLSMDSLNIYLNFTYMQYITEFASTIIHISNRMQAAAKKRQSEKDDSEEESGSSSTKKSTSTKSKTNQSMNNSDNGDKDLLLHLIRRKSSERLVSVHGVSRTYGKQSSQIDFSSFSKELVSLSIPAIKIVAESLNYEAFMLLTLENTKINAFTNPENGFYAMRLITDGAKLHNHASFTTRAPELNSPIILIGKTDALFEQQETDDELGHNNFLNGQIDIVRADLNTNQIATIKELILELTPNLPKTEKRLELAAEDAFPLVTNVTVSQIQGQVRDQFNVEIASAVISNTVFTNVMNTKGGMETTVTLDNIFAQDVRKEANWGGVIVMRWSDYITAADAPHVRLQTKRAPPVGGIKVYNHVELNIEPTTINYDADFGRKLIDVINSKIIAPEMPNSQQHLQPVFHVSLPSILVAPDILPKTHENIAAYFAEIKSSELSLMVKRAEQNFLMRYFKVTNARMNVSYKNEENSFVSEINSFNGHLHDIIYQDLTASFEELVSKLFGDVARDVIPQFLKHLVGLGKAPACKVSELRAWLNTTDAMAVKKQIIFGKKNTH